MTGGRKVAAWAVTAAALAAALAIGGALTLRSDWFRGEARRKLAEAVAEATGGRVEIGTLTLDRRVLRCAPGTSPCTGRRRRESRRCSTRIRSLWIGASSPCCGGRWI